jgi:predicted methyltransferase
MHPRFRNLILALIVVGIGSSASLGQEKSVRPGINDAFKDPDVKHFTEVFETESREIFAKRKEIVAACKIKPGTAVADIGAGTGLFTLLFPAEVGDHGKVYAVEIAPKFVEHIEKLCKEKGIKNVVTIPCKPDSTELPPNSIDLAFICDTYHHFEYPFKTMTSIHRALRPEGRVILVDFKRIQGVSSDWVMNHVRAGQETFNQEIESTGFKVVEEQKILKENYCLVFKKVAASKDQPNKK